MLKLLGLCSSIVLLALSACGPALDDDVAEAYASLPATLDYNFDVRPILSDRCWSCHGPDARARMAGLRLDVAEHAYAVTDEHVAAIVPGDPGRSELVSRILSHDDEYRMPTLESNLTLTPREKAILVKWVEDGAQYDQHWAFSAPQSVADADELSGAGIDRFIREGYERTNLKPNGPADARTLVRRVYRDLTGLPPTYAQTAAYVADPSEAHYTRLVDSLLATDAAAEHLTREWLDVARYADSHGLHADGIRTSWPWRDWVIRAFRQNMPYDQFVTEQLAGDLLPGATQDQRLATAFNRNHVMTGEGGADMEEYRINYVMDRTNTFATAFLGLTMECAACHDHKFDPVSQAEYYQLSAFFNNVKEFGMTGDDGDYGPQMILMTDSVRAMLDDIDARIAEVSVTPASLAKQIEFIKGLPSAPRPVAYVPFDKVGKDRADGYPLAKVLDTVYTVPGVRGQAIQFDTEWDAVDVDLEPFEAYDEMSVSMYVRTTKRVPEEWQSLVGNAGDKNALWRGMDFALNPDGQLNLRITHSLPGNYIEVQSERALGLGDWTHVGFTYDGSSSAEGVQLYIDGAPARQTVEFDRLYRGIYPLKFDMSQEREARPYRIGVSLRHYTGEVGIFEGAVDEFKLWDTRLSHKEMASALVTDDVASKDGWDEQHESVVALRPTANKRRNLRKQRLDAVAGLPDVMVMEDMPTERQAYRLDRGVFDARAEPVDYGTPAAVLDFSAEPAAGENGYERNRLGLARWLFAEENPLAARVAVNRYWQHIMGRGIVSTAHDFGMQGALPTHPRLLDYLATGFQASGWDVRQLLRAIVTSETYRLSSEYDEEQARQDPDNAYYTRSSSYRYTAEQIRDYALATSQLLAPKVGGPSVRPYQPKGLWKEKSSFSKALLEYVPQTGDNLYRRSMYTFIRRTSPPPAMTALDQPSRDRCTVTRERTNTPLQALVLLNDPQFVEAARVTAQRIVDRLQSDKPASLVAEASRVVLGRDPAASEVEVLSRLYSQSLTGFAERPADASELLAVGEYPAPQRSREEVAALSLVTSSLLNHDETYMRR